MSPRYNQPIPHMRARTFSGLRLGWLASGLAMFCLTTSFLCASNLGDTARELAHKIAEDSGPGVFALEFSNKSSLEDKSAREVRSALEAELQAGGVHIASSEQASGTITVVLSESLREYVWTAQIAIGSDEKKVVLVSSPRTRSAAPFAAALPIVLKTNLLYAQEQPMLDVALLEMPGGSRLLVLEDRMVAIYRQQGTNPSGRWELETSLPITHPRAFPRDLRGRLFLRRDHLFDTYLPGTFCRSSSSAGASLTLACNPSEDPWPLTAEEGGASATANVRAFLASARNFFTGALSPGIGKISNVPAFYSAAALPRSGYTLWAFAAVDGSLQLVDGMTDQAVRAAKWGSDLAVVHSGCGSGVQLLLSGNGNPATGNLERDALRAYEIPDREPVAVSSDAEFDGKIVALWSDSGATAATAIVKRKDNGWYEAYRTSISCSN